VERYVLPAWSGRRIDEITRRDVLDLLDGIADRGFMVMARRVHAYVHRLFAWCVGRSIIEVNPATGAPKPGSDIKRSRYLNDEELACVARGAEQLAWPFGTALQLLILTGARLREVGELRWSEVDLCRREIRLEGARTKNGEPHVIPLSAAASPLLSGAPRIAGCDFVFSTNGRTAISGWSKAKSELDRFAPCAPWHIHDLRRTLATGMQQQGVLLQVVEAILGHVAGSRRGVAGVYQRYGYEAEKRAALEAWGEHVTALVGGHEPGKVVPLHGTR
jgi:integrase